jgi:hypothetical protein
MQEQTNQQLYEFAEISYNNALYSESLYLTTLNNLRLLNKNYGLEIEDIANRIQVLIETNFNMKKSYKEAIDNFEINQ